jgi:NTP pyrophosphatase (non-canonical NTP hydrolase)
MMTLRQFYLIKLAEECQEVAQRALKSAQFGGKEIQKGQSLTTATRLSDEIMDLLCVIKIIEEKSPIDFPSEFERDMYSHFEMKRSKIQKYLEYSQSLGMVERG